MYIKLGKEQTSYFVKERYLQGIFNTFINIITILIILGLNIDLVFLLIHILLFMDASACMFILYIFF